MSPMAEVQHMIRSIGRVKMPDITMCSSEECPLKKDCMRHEVEPNEMHQSYSDFYDGNEDGDCDYYIPVT